MLNLMNSICGNFYAIMTSASSKQQQSYYLKEVLGRDVKISFGEPRQQRPKFYVGKIIGVEIKYRKKRLANEVKHYIKFEDGRDSVWMDLTHMESIGCLKWPQNTDMEMTTSIISSGGCRPEVPASYANHDSDNQDSCANHDSDNQDGGNDNEEASSTGTVSDPEQEGGEEEETEGTDKDNNNDIEMTTSISSVGCRPEVPVSYETYDDSENQDSSDEEEEEEEASSTDTDSDPEEEEDTQSGLEEEEDDEEHNEATYKSASPIGVKKKRRTWDEAFESVKTFYQQNGDSMDHNDSRWISWQRNNIHNLTSQQIQKLDSINFDWETSAAKLEKRWNKMFGLLKEYKLQNGNTCVPQQLNWEGENLGNWVSGQMQSYRQNKIRRDRKERLDNIGFEWCRDERFRWKEGHSMVKFDDFWNKKFRILKEYKDQHGDTLVPFDFEYGDINGESVKLGRWVLNQREHFRNGLLKTYRQKQLERIGFVFQIDETNKDISLNQRHWEIMFERLKEYKKETGHCRVPERYKDPRGSELPASLGVWVNMQRHRLSKDLKHPKIEERKHRLESIGFEF